MRAPVVMLVHRRPDHTRRTVEALARNDGALETDLYVYADGARNPAEQAAVEATRAIFRGLSGFRSVTLIEREVNYGLEQNISQGISEVVAKSGRVIVVEDDVLPAPGFLNFMNAALDKYETEKRVWHIAGWNYPIATDGLPESFFTKSVTNYWGWATWADRWVHYLRDPSIRLSREDRRRFNLDNAAPFYDQIIDNSDGKYRTWGIFWSLAVFRNSGLCLTPAKSLVENTGLDGTGEQSTAKDGEKSQNVSYTLDAIVLPTDIAENAEASARIKRYLRLPPLLYRYERARVFLRRHLWKMGVIDFAKKMLGR